MRSFGLVEEKIYETDYFLEQIKNSIDITECGYNLSAYLSACRSITFVLQSAMGNVDGFREWYETKQKEMSENQLAKFFHNARNESQKVGIYHVKRGHSYIDKSGNVKMRFFFQNATLSNNNKTYETTILEMLLKAELGESDYESSEDVSTLCKTHFKFILGIIFECFSKFGSAIDPIKYYTLDNINRLGLSIEDIEESLGYPRGWTEVKGISQEKRLELIRNHQPDSFIDPIFVKYLNICRYSK